MKEKNLFVEYIDSRKEQNFRISNGGNNLTLIQTMMISILKKQILCSIFDLLILRKHPL